MIYIFLITAFLLSTLLTYLYIQHAWRKNWIDVPNARSSHVKTTPRGGGIVFIGIWFILSCIMLILHQWTLNQAIILLPSSLLIAITGFYDDRHTISPKVRMLIYLIAALFSVIALGGLNSLVISKNLILPLSNFGFVLAVLALLWSTNLFNFMDGLDGIAAIEALFILITGGVLLFKAGGQTLANISWLLAACVGGFSIWNKPPAKIFMGDVGSAGLGFIIMALALLGEKFYGVPAVLWFMLYGVFLIDATLTLIRRALARHAVLQAHRLHAYQRLHQAGWSHQKILFTMISINALLTLLTLAGFYCMQYLPLFATLSFALLIGLYYWVEQINPMKL